jgi:hypothetical protein
LDEIRDAQLGDGADCAAEGGAGHDVIELFGFLKTHDVPVRIPHIAGTTASVL